MGVNIIGESTAIKHLTHLVDRVAATKTSVLVVGESGTGKELVARLLHERSPIKDEPFVPINCGAIPENLIESELFGHKKGSFTGAVSDKPGLFEVANGGTLFLDEIGELPLIMQVKLLRALQDKTIRRVGGTETVKIDVRIIAATNRDLEQAIANGTFRDDLYYRLNVILIRTPPLRERKEDIMLLANTFLDRFKSRFNKENVKGFDLQAVDLLENYPWPGNVRELENIVERAVALEGGEVIGLQNFPQSILTGQADTVGAVQKSQNPASKQESALKPTGNLIAVPEPDFDKGAIDLDQILNDIERTYLRRALEHTGGVKKKAADHLGITFRSIRYRLKKLGFDE